MSIADLQGIVDFAVRNRLALNCLLGRRPLPAEHERVLAGATHVKLVPFEQRQSYPTAMVVVDGLEQAEVLEPAPGRDRNVILRLRHDELEVLAPAVEALLSRCRRVNLRLLDMDRFGDVELRRDYPRQMEQVVAMVRERYAAGDAVEVSFLSDRLLHTSMHNCNAGLEHVTFAPDGRFYICPGFYYDDLPPVGDLEHGIAIPNQQLLRLDHAPICSVCDAYHCKRCVYLNRQATGEVNTPPRQQCVLAHIERNASARLLASLQHIASFRAMAPLRETTSLDPFARVAQGRSNRQPIQVQDGQRLVTLPPLQQVKPQRTRRPAKPAKPLGPDGDPTRDILEEIRRGQRAILEQLRALSKEGKS